MKVIIRGDKLEVTDAINDYIEKKIGKLQKYFDSSLDIEAKVLVKNNNKNKKIEVTIPSKKLILRAEDSHEDLYAAIDLVSEKLERQIRKNKTRMRKKSNEKLVEGFNVDFDGYDEELETIVKRKKIDMKPMSEEEAILQMDMLGHNFFIFKNDIDNNINIVYKRKDGNYGLIETN